MPIPQDTSELFTVFEQRLTLLESKVAFQEDTIEQLNQALIVSQIQIQKLRDQLRLVAEKMAQQTSTPLANPQEERPPPHY